MSEKNISPTDQNWHGCDHNLALFEAMKPEVQDFNYEPQEPFQACLCLKKALRDTLDLRQFELHYQPLVDVVDECVFGFEALVRWNHPRYGQVPPNAFIPGMKQNGHIVQLTEWVTFGAIKQLRRWEVMGFDNLKIAVNIPPMLLEIGDFVDLIDRCLATIGCDPRCFVIEITEEALVDEVKVISALKALRERGVTIAIDDFGTGYSSIARLKKLPIDILKIDRSFLAGATRIASHATIIKSLVNVGHRLGMKVVAEGVETTEQLIFLNGIGCDIAQGFLINRPMAAADIPSWLEQWQSSRVDFR